MTPVPGSANSMDGNGALATFPAAPSQSPVGYLHTLLPAHVRDPPIETVLFAWGINEDGQLGIESAQQHVSMPKVRRGALARGRGQGT